MALASSNVHLKDERDAFFKAYTHGNDSLSRLHLARLFRHFGILLMEKDRV